ncbi:flavin oxidoreductase [Enemella evansiae]|uniref:Flavin oxidoreductase n=1 Tax=Enemella evansiae TaxID=2016499 RepID=A0A255GFE7_9ACTN|nr:flavin reductase family protein [Enemella evansiae]OYO14311.1 flavin oxidoreductase [Enemella evansiae]
MTGTTAGLDPTLLRDVLGHYPTGVVLVTGVAPDGEQLAMVVGTFTAVSLEPPLVAFLPMRSSRTFARLQECASLCINVLAGDQEEICRAVASRRVQKFEGLDWFPSPSGDPVLTGSVAWMDVRLESTIDAGDHWIAMCRVADLAVHNPVAPLIFFQRGYGSFVIPSLVARRDDGIIAAVQSASVARNELQRLAHSIGCEVSLLTAVNRDELAAVASAVGPGVSAAEGLGERVPMVPPIGDTYMCHASAEDRAYWLAKANDAPEDQRQVFTDRLEFCRRNGYLMSFLPPGRGEGAYADLHHAAHLYATGRLTPAQERDMRASIHSSQVDYALRDLVDTEDYHVGSVVLPLGDSGEPANLTLRLAKLPYRSTGAQVREWIADARTTADRIATRLTS